MKIPMICFDANVLFLENADEWNEEKENAQREGRAVDPDFEKNFGADVVHFEIPYGSRTVIFHPHKERNKTLLLIDGDSWKIDMEYLDFKEMWDELKKELLNEKA